MRFIYLKICTCYNYNAKFINLSQSVSEEKTRSQSLHYNSVFTAI